jgi:hypothetical protein
LGTEREFNFNVSRLIEELEFFMNNYEYIQESDYPIAYVVHPKILNAVQIFFSNNDLKHLKKTLKLININSIEIHKDKKLKDLNGNPTFKIIYDKEELAEYI